MHDPACCAMGNTSRAFLRLPALRELAVQVRLPTGQLLRIEQDGLLRPFDLPTVLWPAGYLLALWAATAASGCAPGAKVVERLATLALHPNPKPRAAGHPHPSP